MVQQLLQDRTQTWQLGLFSLLIVVVTAVPFLGSLDNDFVNWDDGVYVTHNRQIQDLSWDSIQEIFSTPVRRTYAPLTLLSLGLDHAIWSLDPFGYHLTNLLLHLANTLLLFLLMWRLTNHLLPSLLAALLFGVHPVHVESVVWITERKDVLSTLFFLTSLLCYLRFRSRQGRIFYCLSLASFVLALLSKQMTITLPLVILLCDFLAGRAWTWRVFVEKLPYLLLSLVFGLGALLLHNLSWWPVTGTSTPVLSEEQKVHSPQEIVGDAEKLGRRGPPAQQVQGSPKPSQPESRNNLRQRFSRHVSPLLEPGVPTKLFLRLFWGISFTLGKALLLVPPSIINYTPRGVAFLKPTFFLPVVLVSLFIAMVWFSRRYTRVIVFGSLFFFLTLLPALKFLPFWADRFFYIPSIGLCYLAGLAFQFFYTRWRRLGRGILAATVGGLVVILGVLTWQRSEVWQDSESLWLSAVQDHPDYADLHHNLGLAYLSKGKLDAAIGSYQAVLDLDAKRIPAMNNLGTAYARKGEFDEAISWYKQALVLRPDYAQVYGNLGSVNIKREQYDAAIADFRKALELEPRRVDLHYNIGIAWHRKGKLGRAISHYRKAIELNPYQAMVYHSLALALHSAGKKEEAQSTLRRSQQLFPQDQTAAELLQEWRRGS